MRQIAGKPGSVPHKSGVLIIYLGLPLPTSSSGIYARASRGRI